MESVNDKAARVNGGGAGVRSKRVDAATFYEAVRGRTPGTVQCAVTLGRMGGLTDHHPVPDGPNQGAELAAKVAGRAGGYHAVNLFREGAIDRHGGRTKANVAACRALWLDIEGGADKYEKTGGPDGGYNGRAEAMHALTTFVRETRLVPNFVVETGNDGLHPYYLLNEPVAPRVWAKLASALAAMCTEHGLKIDAQCTTDSARCMRAPGSIHQKTARPVEAVQIRPAPYTLEEVASLLGVNPESLAGEIDASLSQSSLPQYAGANADILAPSGAPPDYSYSQAAQSCPAMAQAAANNGRGVQYPVWVLALSTAKSSMEGRGLAHRISSGHSEYDHAETDRKLDSLSGGPASCGAWGRAYGPGGPCETCPHAGAVTNPGPQLGRVAAPSATESGSGVMAGGELAALSEYPTAVLRRILPDWKRSPDGTKVRPLPTVPNIEALSRGGSWRLQYNVMTRRTELVKPGMIAPRDDADNAALALFGDVAVRAGLSRDGLPELVDAAAGNNPYHPVDAWIESVPRDGVSRAEQFHEHFELADPSHTQVELRAALLDAFMLQCIGAVYEPDGIAAQGMLVLAGPQGCGKTRLAASLCPIPGAVKTGLHINPADRDSVLQATSCWIAEVGELDSTTRRSDVSQLKAFTTRNEDTIRPAYARRENTYRRRTCFVGTVNGTGFLVDDTGNRRFWTLAVSACRPLDPAFAQQLWAEYLHRYRSGQRWHLSERIKALMAANNADFTTVDPLRERIASRLDWNSVDWPTVDPANWQIASNVVWRTATDVCLLAGLDKPTRAEATRVGAIVRELQGISTGYHPPSTGYHSRLLQRRSNGKVLLAIPATRGMHCCEGQ